MASHNHTKHAIEAAQCRAARGLLNWSRERLAEASAVPMRTIADVELGKTVPRASTVARLVAALEAAGVELIGPNGGGPGVRLRTAGPAGDHQGAAAAPDARRQRARQILAEIDAVPDRDPSFTEASLYDENGLPG